MTPAQREKLRVRLLADDQFWESVAGWKNRLDDRIVVEAAIDAIEHTIDRLDDPAAGPGPAVKS